MPNPFLISSGSKGEPTSTNPFIGGSGLSSRGTSLTDEVATLEQLQQATGAPAIEQEQPGFLARTVDVLSGVNFAIAGATEELATGRGLGSAVGRFATELYSSARSLPLGQFLPKLGDPQKKAFGEVFEGLGFGTHTLADTVPMMEGTFIGELVNTRGTMGLALDIVADPLTYFSFGQSAVARLTLSRFAKFGLKKGVNKKGLAKLSELQKSIRGTTRGLTDEAIEDTATRALISLGDETLFDPGGVKFAGIALGGMPGMPTEQIASMGKPLVDALNTMGVGRRAVRVGESIARAGRGIVKTLSDLGAETFDPFFRLNGLSAAQKTEAERTWRLFENSGQMLMGRYTQRIKGGAMWEGFKDLPKDDLKRIFDQMEVGRFVPKNQLEERAGAELRAMVEEIGADGVAAGIFDPKQIAANPFYVFHNYLNDTLDTISETHLASRGTISPLSAGTNHAQGKVFASLVEAAEVSGRLDKLTAGMRAKGAVVPRWKQLDPNYDIVEGMLGYVDWFVKQKTVRGMAEEMATKFGWDVDNAGAAALKFLGGASDYITPEHAEWERVYAFFENKRTLGGLAKEISKDKIAGFDELMKDARKHLGSLKSEHAQRQFIHELFLKSGSLSKFDSVMEAFKDKVHLMPRAMTELLGGTTEDALKVFGDAAVYVERGANSIYGKKAKMIPKLVADMVENVETNILDGREFDGVRKAIDAWHTTNNLFKTAVYPLFPASHTRNAISNVFLNGIRMGVHALSPKLHKHSIAILAGKEGSFVSKTGKLWKYDEVREIMEQTGTLARVEDILERTGRGTKKIKGGTKAGKLLRKGISFNENESRGVLFIQDLMDGLNPAEAAQDVGDTIFNYNEIAPIHRFLQNFVPFTTFTLKNIRAQINALRRVPGVVATELKPFRGRSSENESMVKWEAEGLKLRINKDGKTVTALTGIDLPMRNMDVLWAGGFGATGRRLMGMMTPLIKVPIEQITGKNLFTGRKLDRANAPTLGRLAEHLPGPMKDWIGYKKVNDEAGRPQYSMDGVKYNLLVRSFVLSRIMSTSDRQFREYADDNQVGPMMLDLLSGLRFKDMDLDDQRERLMRRRKNQLRESLVRRGVLPPSFEVSGGKPNLEGLR